MVRRKKTIGRVVSQTMLAEDILDLRLETFLASDVMPGQFVGVYPAGADALLPRPISVCDADREAHVLRLVYRLTGRGTTEFALKQPGEVLEMIGPLGNGFPVEEAAGKRVLLIGGGIGIPPLYFTASLLSPEGTREYTGGRSGKASSITSVLGYKNIQTFMAPQFAEITDLYLATEDGSAGYGGTDLDALFEIGRRREGSETVADIIFACGPSPMLKAVKEYALIQGVPAYLSLEERMACGVGACLACVCKTRNVDAHSNVHNARVCTDGPVFPAREVVL
ncbi:MAG: dihydroorotate dehydrogenase electron transfer subunit [Lachnospiraceae bacterium]|nr:dihydroorotate dehydrogenase electron transfer subunit [Lachnospiraceae bacterium]